MSEDTSWVFDSLVCFLHGPVWNAPLQTFVEEKSLIFDPNERPDCTNPEYVRIHDDYKNLVDFMLGSFMDEMQITPAQFEVACLEGRQTGPSGNAFSFHQGLFQQIWAANDIRIFVRMMTQRNVELQLQALDLIEHRQQNLTDADAGQVAVNGDGEADGGGEAAATKATSGDDSRADLASTSTETSPDRELFETIEKVLLKENITGPAVNADATEVDGVDDKFKRLNLFFEKEKITEADVQSRQQYLRTQRDRILAVKKKARAQQLNESVRRNGRPGSAQAAQTILERGTGPVMAAAAASAADSAATGGGGPHEASLQLRRTLARRLRTEVVDGGGQATAAE